MATGAIRSKSQNRRLVPYEGVLGEDSTGDVALASIFGATPEGASSSVPNPAATGQFHTRFAAGAAEAPETVDDDMDHTADKHDSTGRQRGQGSAGRGRGAGKGSKGNKGSGRGKGAGKFSSNVQEVLQTHAKALLQLDQHARSRDKECQWAVLLPVDGEAAALLVQTANTWKAARPEEGKHPSGMVHECCWIVFCKFILSKLETTPKSQAVNQLTGFLKDSMVETESHQPSGKDTFVKVFRPIQNKPPTTGLWIWILRPSMALSAGREMHEVLSYWSDKFTTLLAPIKIRKDRVPPTGLLRAVEGRLKAMQIG